MFKIKIRLAEKRDINFIYNGERQIAIAECSEIPVKNNKLILEALAQGKILIAEFDGKVVGFIWIETTNKVPFGVNYEPRKYEYAWVNWVYVTKEYRKKGVATALYAKLEEYCKKRGLKKIILDIYDVNLESVKFHETLDFHRRVGIWEKEIKMNNNKGKRACSKCRHLFKKEETVTFHSGKFRGTFCKKCVEVFK